MKLLSCSCQNPSEQQTNKMHKKTQNSATFAKATITTQIFFSKKFQNHPRAYSFAVRA
jgi:hypothetical protein